jgi:sialidase-1
MINDKVSKTEPIAIFEPGLKGAANYRIPSMITTQKGTVIAAIDARVDEPGDNPNNIDKVIRRSTDNGNTWDDVRLLVDYPGRGRREGSAAIDPSMLEDRETGTIWMIFNHTPGGIGLWQSHPGIGFNSKGCKLLYDELNNEYVLNCDGTVFDNHGNKTDMTVNKEGNVYRGGEVIGNIYLDRGPLLEARTSFLQAIYSNDDGLTWSDPIDLNSQVKEPWMRFIGPGPGIGIQLNKSKHKGRLVFPIYYSNNTNSSYPRMSCCLIYSDDHGKTWHRGQSPNDGRHWEGMIINSRTLNIRSGELTESQVVELENGEIMYFMRNHSDYKRTAFAYSKDGGETWGEVKYSKELIDPICQSTVLRYPDMGDGKDRLIYANPADEKERINGTVKLSEDGGITWPYSRVVKEGDYMYSCLTILMDNNIGLLYEADEKIMFTKFTLDWIKGM